MNFDNALLDELARVYAEACVEQLLAELQNEQGPTLQTSGLVDTTTTASTTDVEAISDPA